MPFCTLPCGDSKRDELLGEDLRKPILKLPPVWAAAARWPSVLFAHVLGNRQLKSITMFDARHKKREEAVLI